MKSEASTRCAMARGLCLLALVGSLLQGGAVSASGPVQGGSLTVGIEEDFVGFDPIKARFLGAMDRNVLMAVQERLFDLDENGNLVPELALSASTSPDGRVWTIRLREGVAFHDGTPFNAGGVSNNSSRSLIPDIKSMAKRYPMPAKNPWVRLMKKLPDTLLPFLKNISEFNTATPNTAQFTVIKGR